MAEALFGTLDAEDQARLEAHLATCPACAQLYQELQATLQVMARRERPAPPPGFWHGYTDRLEARLDADRRDVPLPTSADRAPQHPSRSRWRTWALRAGAAVLCLLLGIWIGRGAWPDAEPGRSGGPAADPLAIRPAAVQQAEQYLGRSKVLLLGLVNTEATEANLAVLDLPRKQALARDLLVQAPALQADLEAAGQRRLQQLVADLEVILLQIANLEAAVDVPAIELVQSSVDQQALLLKINVTEMRLATEGRPPASAPVHRP